MERTEGRTEKGKDASGSDVVYCSKNKILLVDDERAIRRLFQLILKSGAPDCEVDLAADGAEALDSFRSVHHCLIIMDLHMPVMDGQTAFLEIQKLCEAEQWEEPSIVFCTGYAPPDMVKRVVSSNEKHCLLSKPISGEMLVDTVRSRLR